jgi:two-component system, LuxR family, response regulator FixJ
VTQDNRDERSTGRRIVVVDDDAAVRESTVVLIESAGHAVAAFESGAALVEAGVPRDTDVILLDMMMPGLNGLDTLRALRASSGELPPVVVLTGHGDIALAVEAMKLGAAEFLEKPYPMKDLLELVSTLEKGPIASPGSDPQRSAAQERIAQLSSRQREVLKGMAMGEPSKVTAYRLGLSVRTVEAYRGHVFGRLGVRGMAEAVRIAVEAGLLES